MYENIGLFGVSKETDELLTAAIAYRTEVNYSSRGYSGTEADIVALVRNVFLPFPQFVNSIRALGIDLRKDTAVYELRFQFGRADIVVFQSDGGATVIEVKNGDHGYQNVVAGIGQVGLYAAQLGMDKASLRYVRRCLLWTSTRSAEGDEAIEAACKEAGVHPVILGPLRRLIAWVEAMESTISAVRHELGVL